MIRFVKWIIFSVIIALLPLAFNFLSLQTKGGSPTLEQICSKGELLLICVGISAAALGELMGGGGGWTLARLLAGGGSLVILIFSALWFADISTCIAEQIAYNTGFVARGSILVFMIGTLCSGLCIVLSQDASPKSVVNED